MSRAVKKKHKRFQVGGLPLLHALAQRIGLRDILADYIPSHGNETIPAVDSLVLLIYNLTLGKEPLYALEDWAQSIDPRAIGYARLRMERFNDDRFGRALDKLYRADRASLLTKIVVALVKEFQINLSRVHNDSTTVKAYGKMAGKTKTGFQLKRGKSKDHRPDLKQLVFSLSISSDGAVPVHSKSYPGNRVDDKTHMETWNTIRKIKAGPEFLYVADSKLCSDEQLSYIVDNGGKAVTILPEYWREVKAFKESLRKRQIAKELIWRRPKPGSVEETESFSTFKGTYTTTKRGYRIHWISSSEKRKRDRFAREQRLKKAERDLITLRLKLNKRNLKTKKAIEDAATSIFAKHAVENLLSLEIGMTKELYQTPIGKGRPGRKTKYKGHFNTLYTLSWTRNAKALKDEQKTDGIFPLLCTDEKMTAKEVLKAYKYQPRLEKRFSQFKGIHRAAPLLFKKIERVEANMFAFFIALILQSLLEREVRRKMKKNKVKSLTVYPEQREASHPTTCKVLTIFDPVSAYQISQKGTVIEEYKDELNDTQKTILKFLGIPQHMYWQAH